MPSPFPGMNPYFEPHEWRDFHTQFIASCRAKLNAVMPQSYFAGIEVDVVLREPSADDRRRRPDVAITRDRSETPGVAVATLPSAPVTQPTFATLPELFVEDKRRWIEVFSTRPERKLVTHVELLSPSNKEQDREVYLEKRARLLRSDVNFVEIDLLRGGGRMPMDGLAACDYCVMVRRPADGRNVAVWPMALRGPLATIPIPLLPPDADVALDLQALLHAAYDEAGYARDPSLYARPPEPPLSADDAAWAEAQVAAVRDTHSKGAW